MNANKPSTPTKSFVYIGQVNRDGYINLTQALESYTNSNLEKEGHLTLITYGGEPGAAYRIARAMGHHFPEGWSIFIPDICKSAGTLIAIGAKEVVISDRGELGPLDVQLKDKDELFTRSSGLEITSGLDQLRYLSVNLFREHLIELTSKDQLSTEVASKIALGLTNNLIAPIAKQINPIKLGKHQRELSVAIAYGERLNKKFNNIKTSAITKSNAIIDLTANYPSHSFVIDRKEACNIFERVRPPNDGETALEKKLLAIDCNPYSIPAQVAPIDLANLNEQPTEDE